MPVYLSSRLFLMHHWCIRMHEASLQFIHIGIGIGIAIGIGFGRSVRLSIQMPIPMDRFWGYFRNRKYILYQLNQPAHRLSNLVLLIALGRQVAAKQNRFDRLPYRKGHILKVSAPSDRRD